MGLELEEPLSLEDEGREAPGVPDPDGLQGSPGTEAAGRNPEARDLTTKRLAEEAPQVD
jgi:hypothetical protein